MNAEPDEKGGVINKADVKRSKPANELAAEEERQGLLKRLNNVPQLVETKVETEDNSNL